MPRSLLGPQPPRFLGTDDPYMRVPGHEDAYKPKPKAKDTRNWQQKVRDALNDVGRKYLGPHGDRAFGLLGAASEFTDAADLRDAVEYGGKLGGAVERGDWWGAAGAAPWMLAASGAAMLPGVSLGAADEVAEGAQKGIRAYHGSPHDFDRFDMSKIGTGEGAQAYGHGLYFAEAEGTAESYKKSVQRNMDQLREIAKSKGLTGDSAEMLAHQFANGFGGKSFDDWLYGLQDSRDYPLLSPRTKAAIDEILNKSVETADAYSVMKTPGRMYEVNINADPDTFLDWDKPLSEQPEAVKKALQDHGIQTPETSFNWNGYVGSIGMPTAGGAVKHYAQFLDTGNGIKTKVMGKEVGTFSSIEQARSVAEKTLVDRGVTPQLSGADAYAMIAGEYPGNIGARTKPEAATRLAELGIPGIKYLDAGSRAAGDGSRNYVVFDDRLVSIVRKYGIAGASAILGYNILANMDPAQAAELQQIEGSGW